MKIAYILLCHKNVSQIVRLVRALSSELVVFYLHFDLKSSVKDFLEIQNRLNGYNVVYVPQVKCDWGGFGIVDRMLFSLQEIQSRSEPFDFVIYVSGQCYPIKNQNLFYEFLSENKEFSFVRSFPLPSDKWPPDGGLGRLKNWYFWFNGHRLVFPKDLLRFRFFKSVSKFPFWNRFNKELPLNYRFFGGSSFWVFNHRAVSYIVKFCRDNPKYVSFFKRSFIADEMFFQTLLLNSPIRDEVVNRSLHFISWPDKPSPHPDILTSCDIDKILNSDCFFARKFDESIDSEVLSFIDSNLLN